MYMSVPNSKPAFAVETAIIVFPSSVAAEGKNDAPSIPKLAAKIVDVFSQDPGVLAV
jgi:hypothetical protein